MDVKKIQNAIQWMKNGGLVIVADDEDRESEGDMIGLGCPTFKFLPNGTK